MKRALLTTSAIISTLLLAATCFLWVRSYRQTDDIYWYGEHRTTRFRTSGGGFWFETRPEKLAPTPHRAWEQYFDVANYPFAASPVSPLHERLGFLVSREGYDLLLVMPYWSAALLFSLLPWLRWRGIRRQPRHAAAAEPASAPG